MGPDPKATQEMNACRPRLGQTDPDESDESLKPQSAGVWKTAIIR